MINKHIKLIFPFLLTFISLQSMGQVGELRDNFSVGFNGGVNYSNVTFEPYKIKQNGLMGFSGGLTARYISEKYFAMICGIQLEINYSQRGWDEKFEDEPQYSYSHTMNYLEIPLLAHLAFGKERGARFFLNMGPQIGFLLSESEKISNPFNPTIIKGGTKEQYGKMADKKFDYGITGGLGLEIRTKSIGNFLLEGRYYFGLSDFYNNTKKDVFSRSAHTVIMGKLTYLFDLRK
ncbi:porin family protein [Bacteroides sp. 224]|uniref:porin family protein n=1 Tax=Bacteroides sp. 224 TaxID=2302936 RepID=UPI0013D8DAE3|nr:porin family protein [Bacteroides sp. 224]NDV66004.1 PorT family protein [Bacteroides sp. 224]